MKLKEWLSQKLEDSWSSHRLVHLLSEQVLNSVLLSQDSFDPIVLTRVLLSYLHFNTPAQERQFRESFRELAAACVHYHEQVNEVSQSINGDPLWVRVIAALLSQLIPPPNTYGLLSFCRNL